MGGLIQYKELLFTIATLDLKMKYQNSKIGFFWSLLKPLLQFLAYFTVFQLILHVSDKPDYAVRLFLGILLWSLFAEATSNGLGSYISKKTIITKVKIEKKVLPVAAYLTAFFNFLLTMLVFLVAYFLFAVDSTVIFSWKSVAVLLLFLATYSMSIIAINVVLATLNVLFRDIQNIGDSVLMYGVFLTPIIYTLPIPVDFLSLYYFLNPLAFPFEQMKSAFFGVSGTWNTTANCLSYLAGVGLWLLFAFVVDFKLRSKVADFL